MIYYIGIPILIYVIYVIVSEFGKHKRKNTEDEKELKRLREESIQDAIKKFRSAGNWPIDNNYNILYDLSNNQKKLIQDWLRNDLFQEHTEVFNTIIKNNKYTNEDKKTLSACRNTYLKIQEWMKQDDTIDLNTTVKDMNEK